MKRLTAICLILFCWVHSAVGQDEHPIDLEREHCLSVDSNWTTYGMIRCEVTAGEKWDEEMNKYYKLVMERLTDTQKENLRTAQREWIKFRD